MRKLYPSIPHLPGSRAAADKVLPLAEARRFVDPSAARAGDEVLVEEKLDGSCVAVVVGPDARGAPARLLAFGREGRLAALSANAGRRMFATWLASHEARLAGVLRPGEVLAGEWLALVHGTRYELSHEPFVPFDILVGPERARLSRDALAERLGATGLPLPGLVHRGGPIAVGDALAALGPRGRSQAVDPPEGLVYRLERKGRTIQVAKWVRPDKVDGAFLPENSGLPALYHWTPP